MQLKQSLAKTRTKTGRHELDNVQPTHRPALSSSYECVNPRSSDGGRQQKSPDSEPGNLALGNAHFHSYRWTQHNTPLHCTALHCTTRTNLRTMNSRFSETTKRWKRPWHKIQFVPECRRTSTTDESFWQGCTLLPAESRRADEFVNCLREFFG